MNRQEITDLSVTRRLRNLEKPSSPAYHIVGPQFLEQRIQMDAALGDLQQPLWTLQAEAEDQGFVQTGERYLSENPEAFTMEARVTFDTVEGVQVLLSEGSAGRFVYGLALYGGKIAASVNAFGSFISSDEAVIPGQEYHVALTYDQGKLILFINGIPQKETQQVTALPLNGGEEFVLRGRWTAEGSDLPFQGKMPDAAVFDVALSEERLGKRHRREDVPPAPLSSLSPSEVDAVMAESTGAFDAVFAEMGEEEDGLLGQDRKSVV